ncbi:hypothetical protein LINGRAHAP2_LOCUS2002 [Linum grandiflorum]
MDLRLSGSCFGQLLFTGFKTHFSFPLVGSCDHARVTLRFKYVLPT